MLRNLKKEDLFKMYVIDKKSTCQIGRELNIPIPTIKWNLKKFGIPMRTWGEAKKLNWSKPEYKQMMSNKHRGHIHSEEHKRKISISHKGIRPKNIDWLLLDENNIKKRLANMPRGDKHPFWRGGFDRKDYPHTFNKKLKELIRNRDNHKCQLCGAPECEFKTKLAVHHIDYDKKNNETKNLISLCKYCHTKTNYNRPKWTEYFSKILEASWHLT